MRGNPNGGRERPLIDLSRRQSDRQLTDGTLRSDALFILSPCRLRSAAPAVWARSTLRTLVLRFRGLALEGVCWTAARTEVLLSESPHDCPRSSARCSHPSSLRAP